jgi:hypothetical protein
MGPKDGLCCALSVNGLKVLQLTEPTMPAVITELWEAIGGGHHRGLAVAELSDFGRKNFPMPRLLVEWLAVFDEFAEWFVSLSNLICLVPLVAGEELADDQFRAFAPLLCSISSQCIAIRSLVTTGLELPSKQICRCLVEYVDLAVRMSLDEAYTIQFLAHQEIDDARRFWRAYLKRRDLKGDKRMHMRDTLFDKISRLLPTANIQELEAFRKQEEDISNACTHPSLAAARVNMVGTYLNDESSLGSNFLEDQLSCLQER